MEAENLTGVAAGAEARDPEAVEGEERGGGAAEGAAAFGAALGLDVAGETTTGGEVLDEGPGCEGSANASADEGPAEALEVEAANELLKVSAIFAQGPLDLL